MLLPDGSGTDVANAARNRWPNIPVLFMSGFTGDQLDQQSVTGGSVEFIAKPFLPKELISRVNEILARNSQQEPVAKIG